MAFSVTRWKARHTVLSILFVSWVVSFMDRTAMSVVAPFVAKDFHLSATTTGVLLSAFFASYSLSQIPGGLLADRFGVRRVATVGLVWWSCFTLLTGAAASFTQMLAARFLFGLGEGIFPACAFKAIAVWFPSRERATANGIRQAAGPLGAALSPLIVVGIMSAWDWRAVFFCMCAPGILISWFVWRFVRDRPADSARVSPAELMDLAEGSGPAPASRSSARLSFAVLRDPTVLKCCLITFALDIAYWGFSTWLPSYLMTERGFSPRQMGVAASLPFFAGTIASVLGGWLSDRYFADRRRIPIIAMQLATALLLYLLFETRSSLLLVIYETLAGFCFNIFFTAFWAIPMNTVSRDEMGLAAGVINMGAQVAAFISPILVGSLVDLAGGSFAYVPVLMIGAVLTSCALVFLVPNKLARPSDGVAEARQRPGSRSDSLIGSALPREPVP